MIARHARHLVIEKDAETGRKAQEQRAQAFKKGNQHRWMASKGEAEMVVTLARKLQGHDPDEFKTRKVRAEAVRERLNARGVPISYQRVYRILADRKA
jgi:hypothetical protein